MCPRGAQMDTSSEVAATDTLGRRIAPRQRHTRAEKRAMVEESRTPGVSVALVARRHEVNANQIISWRRMYRAGLLDGKSSARPSQLLPVKIAEATSATAEERVRPRRTILRTQHCCYSRTRPSFTPSRRSAAILLASTLSRAVPHTDRRLISNSPWTGRFVRITRGLRSTASEHTLL
jgi:transposase-like protein